MNKNVRSDSLTEAKERLARKHEQIDARVAELDRRKGLSATEADELRQLKKAKLQFKDELASLGGGDG